MVCVDRRQVPQADDPINVSSNGAVPLEGSKRMF